MNTMMIISISLSCFAAFTALVGTIFAFLAYSTTVGLRNSTHNIEWREVPAGESANNEKTEDFEKQLKKMLEDDELEHV